jgi:hypothetical protein
MPIALMGVWCGKDRFACGANRALLTQNETQPNPERGWAACFGAAAGHARPDRGKSSAPFSRRKGVSQVGMRRPEWPVWMEGFCSTSWSDAAQQVILSIPLHPPRDPRAAGRGAGGYHYRA